MTYMGPVRIECDDADRVSTGRIAGARDGVSFDAESMEGLRQPSTKLSTIFETAPGWARSLRRLTRTA